MEVLEDMLLGKYQYLMPLGCVGRYTLDHRKNVDSEVTADTRICTSNGKDGTDEIGIAPQERNYKMHSKPNPSCN